MACILKSEAGKRIDHNDRQLDKLGSDIAEVIRMEQALAPRWGNARAAVLDIGASAGTVEDFVRGATGGSVASLEGLAAAPDELKNTVRLVLDSRIRTLARMGVDYMGESEQFMLSDWAADVYRAESRRSKGSTKLLGKIPWAFVAMGEWHRAVQQFAPSRVLYEGAQELRAFLGRQFGQINERLAQAYGEFEKKYFLSGHVVDRYLGWFDGQFWNEAQKRRLFDEMRGDTDGRKALEQTINIMRSQGSGIAPDDLEAGFEGFVRLMQTFQRDYWNVINYGTRQPSADHDASRPEYRDSLTGTLDQAGRMMFRLLSVRKAIAEQRGGRLTDSEQRYYDKLNPDGEDRFRLRVDNYVPSRHIEADEMLSLLSDTSGFMAPTSAALERRGQVFSDPKAPLSSLLVENMRTIKFAFDILGSYAMAKGTQDAIEIDPSFRSEDGDTALYHTLKYWSTQLVSGHEQSRPARESQAMTVTRNVLTALHSIGAIVLANPASPVNNYLGGWLGAYGQFGWDVMRWRKAYKSALKDAGTEGEIARQIEAFSTRHMTQPGRYSDYLASFADIPSNHEGLMVRASEKVQTALMKVADFATRQGVIPVIQPALQLTMETSEANLRKIASPVLFDMVRARLGGIDLASLSPEKRQGLIADAIQASRVEAYFELNNALLDPNKENRPFWAWQMARNADNIPQLLAGEFLALSYMFRQVTAHNIRLMGNAIQRAGDDIFGKNNAASKYAGGGALGFLLVALGLSIYEMMAGRKLGGIPRFSAPVSVNPAQEVVTAASAFGAFMNMEMSEDRAMEVAEDFSRLFGGVIGGGIFQHLAKDMLTNEKDRPLGSYFDVVGAMTKDIDLVFHMPYAILTMDPASTSAEYRDTKAELRGKLESDLPWFNHQNDYLSFVRNVLMAAIPTEKDSYAERDRTVDRSRFVLSFFGLSPGYKPGAYRDAYERRMAMEAEDRQARRQASYDYANGRDLARSPEARILSNLVKYGKFYPPRPDLE